MILKSVTADIKIRQGSVYETVIAAESPPTNASQIIVKERRASGPSGASSGSKARAVPN
jgi:hypothetical protein